MRTYFRVIGESFAFGGIVIGLMVAIFLPMYAFAEALYLIAQLTGVAT